MGLVAWGCQDPMEGRWAAQVQCGAGCVLRVLLPRKAKSQRPGGGREGEWAQGREFACFFAFLWKKCWQDTEEVSREGALGAVWRAGGTQRAGEQFLSASCFLQCACVCAPVVAGKGGHTVQRRIPVALCSLSKNHRCVTRVPEADVKADADG